MSKGSPAVRAVVRVPQRPEGFGTRCPALLSRQQERRRARRILLQNSFLMHLESESISRHGGDPERGEPSPYIGNSPRLGRVTLRLVSCPSSQMTPRERQGLQRWKFTNTCALSCSPGGGTGCQRHLGMANVVTVLYISPPFFFFFFAERQFPQKAKIEVALPKVETL